MCKYLLLLLILITVTAAEGQNVFNSGDAVINYNSGAAPGSAANPNGQLSGMQKWVRTRNTSRIPWDDTKFKCYYWKPTSNFGCAFRLRYPNNYDSTKKYPLILFLHGAGEVGVITENEDHLYWGANDFQTAMNAGAWNGFLLFPQQTSAGWDNNYFMLCNSILDTLERYKGFDPDRLITMGLSEGGYGAISMASIYPKRVASIVSSSPIDLTNIGNQAGYMHIPVYWANGGTDANPDPYSSYNYYDNMHNLGANWVQQYYSTQGHGIWPYQWTVQDINGVPVMYNYWNSAHKAQPLVYFNQTKFCVGTPVSAKMGLTDGFYAYQWQMSTGGGAFADIPGATASTYTATQAGTYRVHFKRTSTSNWSDWTPDPVVISVKSCAIDTVFSENFEYWKPYQISSTPQEFKANYTRFDCENSIYTTGAETFTNDAAGNTGARFSMNFTNTGSGCTYTTTGKIWGLNGNVPAVKPNTNYLFTFYAANQSTNNRAALVPYIGTTAVTTLLTKPTALPFSTTGNLGWTRFTYLWNSGSNTFADMSLHNNTTSTNGNDYAIDEISLTRLLAPGGVSTNLMLWNKADVLPEADSTKLVDWVNASGGTPLTQLSAGLKPILRNNSSDNINFNPLVSFKNSLSQNMAVSGGYSAAAAHTAAHIFMVARVNNNTQNTTLVAETQSTTNGRVGVSLPFGGNVVWDAGNTNNSSHMTTPFIATDVNKPILWSFSKDNVNNTGSGNKQDIRRNGFTIAASGSTSNFTGNNSDFVLGWADVRVAELIYYLDANINATSQNRIESYLAAKYGLTLGYKASPVNYTASDGTIFWPANTTFQSDVFGIGVDSLSGLNQLQSNSINSGSGDGTGQSGKGNLMLTAISALGDKDFLMIGNDSTTLAEHIIIPGEAPAAVQTAKRVGREWRVENTGGVGQVTLTFDTTGLTLAGGSVLGNFALMVDSDGDGDFTTGTLSVFYATSSSGKQINFSGVTLNDNTVFSIITQKAASSLPATWLGFTAEAVNGNGVLNWKTSEEINVDYYAVEHSTDGLNFNVIGIQHAYNSMGINDYNYTQQSLSAGTHYYRIRRVDRDGVYKYSDVKAIKISAISAIQIRPNPVVGSTLTLAVSVQQSAPTSIQVVTMDGKVVMRNNTRLVQGLNTINLNVSDIPTGIYLVQIQLSGEVITKKFIRAH